MLGCHNVPFLRKQTLDVFGGDPLILQRLCPDHGLPSNGSTLHKPFKLVRAVGAIPLLIHYANEVPLLFRLGHLVRIIRPSWHNSQVASAQHDRKKTKAYI